MKHHTVKIILISALFFFFFLIYRLIKWAASSFAGLTFEKIVFQLNVPIQGSSSAIINSAIRYCLYPGIAITAVFLLFLLFCDRSKKQRFLKIRLWKNRGSSNVHKFRVWPIPFSKTIGGAAACALLILCVVKANNSFKLFDYIDSQIHPSLFIQQNYVNPESVKLTFPSKKRNLIYIYMESMESTYADTADGGDFPDNYIPELTELADKNINFSNNSVLGGAIPVSGTQWTMGAMFAHSTGLPLKIPIYKNSMNKYAEFFPGVTTIGDILQKNGYKNVLFIGSDATYGGRKLFFTQHGNYEICDYYYAKNKGLIPRNYSVWWGYEDQKLFSFAKDKLTELSKGSQPFNFTLLTADTHFQNGYKCPLCQSEFSSQYANVIACSSRQVTSFVKWIQQQDFYQNTTIVLTGDHETMQTNFCPADPSLNQRSVYDCYINAVPEISVQQTKNRKFSSLDLFPTTLASMGVEIQGNQLGLGVNLFSGEKTLMEKYSSRLSTELDKNSSFYDQTFIYTKGQE